MAPSTMTAAVAPEKSLRPSGRAKASAPADSLAGGEAAASRQAYRDLPRARQQAVLTFLGTLAAPETAPPLPPGLVAAAK